VSWQLSDAERRERFEQAGPPAISSTSDPALGRPGRRRRRQRAGRRS
jgi:hypothetical protein